MSTSQVINIGRNVSVLQLNIEGSSADKSECLSRMANEHKVDAIVIQETHILNAMEYHSRGLVRGYVVAAYLTHANYGLATYIREDHTNYDVIHQSQENDTSMIVVQLFGINITNVYKPPNKIWSDNVPLSSTHPALFVGDFNSHHSLWGYANNDENGNRLVRWAETSNLFLVHDTKDLPTFHSARWQRGYNPDLCFVTRDKHDKPLTATRKVLKKFPRSQHRPIIIKIGIQIESKNSIPKSRWNFQKANWESFTSHVESAIRFIPTDISCYDRFLGVIKGAAKKSIPRGYRKRYIPCWTSEMEDLYKQFEEQDDDEISDRLLELLSATRQAKWEKVTNDMDFTHSSRKAWRLLRHLGESSNPVKTRTNIDPNKIASVILGNSTMIRPEKHWRRKIKTQLKNLKRSMSNTPEFDNPFSLEELATAIDTIKLGKAAGLDGLYPEFIKHLGKRARFWILKFLNKILKLTRLPPVMMKTIIIAILKPGKEADDPTKYRPIALLSIMYKLLERMIYNRIKGPIDNVVPVDQAGFRENRSCVEQVLALTTHIEAGYEKELKTALSLIDLSSAYDTIWRLGFMWKFYQTIPCKKLGQLVNAMLSNRTFRVLINNRSSRPRILNNGVAQGSVCAPIYFNLYTSDVPETISRKFIFADDLALATQVKSFQEGEETLASDLRTMKHYYRKWCLCLNDGKTEVMMFHLDNKSARRELNVYIDGARLTHNSAPAYLGLPLDRSLTYRPALEQKAMKLSSRINLIQKLNGTRWGANGNVLRTAVLSLVYPTAEYCAPVWYRSSHTDKVDTQLNIAMRTITGAVDSTPVPWLHVLSNIAPPNLRRKLAAHNQWKKCFDNSRMYSLPIRHELENPPPPRLTSRLPIWSDSEIQGPTFNVNEKWKTFWSESPEFSNKVLVENPHQKLAGFELPRREWKMLNRFRSGHGCSGDQMYRWKYRNTPYCDCSIDTVQSMNHILNDCPTRKFNGDIQTLNLATSDAVDWLRNLDIDI